MAARMVNAIPAANTNLAGFGAMYPSWRRQIDFVMPNFEGRIVKDV